MFINIKMRIIMIRKIKRVFKWIKRCIDYSIFLWDNYDYDRNYLMRLIIFKLERMRKEYEICQFSDSNAPEKYEMEQAISMLKEIVDGTDVLEDEREEYDKKWGKLEIINVPLTEKEKQNKHIGDKVISRRANIKTEEDKKQAHKEYFEIVDKEDALIQQRYEDVFSFIAKHIDNWWI